MIQAVLGLGWLGSLIGSIALSFIGFQSMTIIKKIAIIAAVLAVITALTTAFIVAIDALLTAIVYAMPASTASIFFLLPSNFVPSVSVYVTAKLAHMVYQYSVRVVQASLYAA